MTTEDKQKLHSILSRLPPGPWHAKGAAVYAGDRQVCIVLPEWQNTDIIAEQIARLPDLLANAVAAEKMEEVEQELATAEKKIEELEDALNDALDDALDDD